MGRKKKNTDLFKNHRITIRLTDLEYEIITTAAEQTGRSLSEYIRHQAIHGSVKVSYPIVAPIEDIQKMTWEIGKIGNNLNQIARYFNSGGMQTRSIREDINECISELMQLSITITEMAGEYNGNTQTLIQQEQ